MPIGGIRSNRFEPQRGDMSIAGGRSDCPSPGGAAWTRHAGGFMPLLRSFVDFGWAISINMALLRSYTRTRNPQSAIRNPRSDSVPVTSQRAIDPGTVSDGLLHPFRFLYHRQLIKDILSIVLTIRTIRVPFGQFVSRIYSCCCSFSGT